MRFGTISLVVLSLASALTPAASFATDWKRAGEMRVQPAYPYANLPGVKAQTDKSLEPQQNCRTETQYIRRRYDQIFRSGGMPMTMYVCDRDGVISSGSQVPLQGHYQPVR